MFAWAISSGLFANYIFLLGLLGKLEYPYILIGTAVFLIYSYWQITRCFSLRKQWQILKTTSFFERGLVLLLVIQMIINLIGAVGPEIAYDAVWYHLTIPRIWLLEEKIFYIENGPFSYSLLPKLLEMFYVAALALSNELVAKIIHWGFGVLCLVVTYRTARLFTTRKYSLVATLVFYSNLVVGWQSITAYIDLGRTFYESLALLAILYATTQNSNRWRYIAGLLLGLAVMSKLIAVTSVASVAILLIYQRNLRASVTTSLLALLLPASWLLLNWLQTGNPVFPVFSGYDLASTTSVFDFFTIWLQSADPLSPIYLMVFPILLIFFLPSFRSYFSSISTQSPQKQTLFKTLSIYCALVFAFWLITPRTGGGRFILPYLPAFSVLIIYPLSLIKVPRIQKIALTMVVFVALLSIFSRAVANTKYLPVIFGHETKSSFLQKNLPVDFGDNWYYLTDQSLQKLYSQESKPSDLEWQYK